MGRKIRIDSTAVETDIHHPTDSTLLCDGIRVITRWLAAGRELSPQPVYPFSDHTRAAKKWLMVILNTQQEKVRFAAYSKKIKKRPCLKLSCLITDITLEKEFK